jgi:hypothetical protein
MPQGSHLPVLGPKVNRYFSIQRPCATHIATTEGILNQTATSNDVMPSLLILLGGINCRLNYRRNSFSVPFPDSKTVAQLHRIVFDATLPY